MHLNESNGYWYLRRNKNGGKETVAKLGKHEGKPSMYRPELHQDKAENILGRLPDNSVDCIITDPPYGIDFEWGDTAFGNSHELGTVANDTTLEFLDGFAEDFSRVLRPDSHCYVFTRWDAYPPMAAKLSSGELKENTVIIWDKVSHGMGDLSDWAPQHEFIMHFEHGDPDLYGKRPTNVIRYSHESHDGPGRIHPTQKPRGLLEELLKVSTRPGDLVLDPFGGSYATARAAMRTFRRSVSCELDPETHRASRGLVERELTNDPEYDIDWTEIRNLEIQETQLVEPLAKA